jgi:hypothetical protein
VSHVGFDNEVDPQQYVSEHAELQATLYGGIILRRLSRLISSTITIMATSVAERRPDLSVKASKASLILDLEERGQAQEVDRLYFILRNMTRDIDVG